MTCNIKKVILISGSPASGKTTLSKTLSKNLYTSLFVYKEKDIILDDISNFVKDIHEILPYIDNVELLIITDPYLTFSKNMNKAKEIFESLNFEVQIINLKVPLGIVKERLKHRNDNRIISDKFLESFFS
jgi:deoxyadenosine/deoxycytidine kinase